MARRGGELEVTPAASQRSRDSDRQLRLSFVAQTQRSSISNKPQNRNSFNFFKNAHASCKIVLEENFILRENGGADSSCSSS